MSDRVMCVCLVSHVMWVCLVILATNGAHICATTVKCKGCLTMSVVRVIHLQQLKLKARYLFLSVWIILNILSCL